MPIALSVVKAEVKTDTTGAIVEIPALITPDGVVQPLLDYCLSRSRDRSLQWMKKVVRSAKLFIQYMTSNPLEADNYRLFMNFAQRLLTGTFDKATGMDESGLGWLPMNAKDAANVATNLTSFFDYLAQTRPSAAKFNPRYAGNRHDRMLDEAAYQYKRDQAFLGHAWASTSVGASPARLVRAASSITVEKGEPPAFPEEHFSKLLTEGFKVGDRYDFRSMLITLLLHGAGFRESEPFHIYVGDVMPDPKNDDSSLVLIHHPSQGAAPSDWTDLKGNAKKGTRAAYLKERWSLSPRNEILGAKAAGWKGGAHEMKFGSYFFRAHWFTPEFGELFSVLWNKYLTQVAMVDRKHPYAFINLGRDPVGGPFSIAQYNKAHAAAVRRIGLTPSKQAGTTPHGHRHAYGRRLALAGVEEELIRRFMHHSSINSQKTYTQPTQAEIGSAIDAAIILLDQKSDLRIQNRSLLSTLGRA